MPARRPPPSRRPPPPAPAPKTASWSERELDTLQRLLDAVPAPLEPLDVVMLDGFLCGVLLQPEAVPASRWRPHVTDVEGRRLPVDFDAAPLLRLVERRHAELAQAIAARRWFDPWVFELDGEPADEDGAEGADDAAAAGFDPGADDLESRAASEAVYPWVAGFATALELFPALMRLPARSIDPPLALVYRHLEPDDLEDAEALLAEIESLEPAVDLADAVEGLVRATLLLADVARPVR